MKITEIQVYNLTIHPDNPIYSADIAIDNSLLLQGDFRSRYRPNHPLFRLQHNIVAAWSIPHSGEASWENDGEPNETQDYAHENYDAEELAEKLGALEKVQDLIDRKVFED
tara:strand:- start:284 stop:616 length:333 start_codon:yes stop_codon:yes gene_type:complete